MDNNMSNSIKEIGFLTKYNPSTFEKFVLTNRLKFFFPNGEIIKNHLFSGSSGLGKSSLAKYLGGKDLYYINSSLQTSIDVLREGGDLYDYCSGFSFDDSKKIVLFDEIDGASPNFFDALKGFMDAFKDSVIFIATTNHPSEIPTENRSRFGEIVDFNFSSDEEAEEHFLLFRNRLFIIARAEGITATKEAISDFAKSYHPDFRYALEALELLKANGITEITDSVIKKERFEWHILYDAIMNYTANDNDKLHKLVTGIANPKSCINSLDNELFDYIKTNYPSKVVKYGNAIIKITEHSNMLSNRVDPVLVLKSLIFTLNLIFKN